MSRDDEARAAEASPDARICYVAASLEFFGWGASMNPTPAGESCGRCSRPMFRGRRGPLGMVRHQCHGRCCSCDNALRRQASRGTQSGGRPGLCAEIDEMAVERALRGYPVALNAVERRCVVDLLTVRGFTTAEVARRTGLAARSVTRIRAAIRKAA